MTPGYKLVFGYRAVSGIPACPCRDGNSVALEQSEADPLDLLFRCWCGNTMKARMEDQAELDELLAKIGVK
jgi:hypothetical protein